MKKLTLTTVALAVVALLLGACGSHDMGSMDMGLMGMGSSNTGDSIPESSDFNDADVMFAQMMIPHHEQAIEMSDIALDPNTGASAAIIALATQIKGAQDPEISQMKNLLTTWGMPTDMGSMDHSSMMDGMLSLEEMATLGQLKGAEFDKAWAKGMIAHHEGAIAMANDVLANGKNSEILALANAVVSGQSTEIETLKPLAG
ncbi:MAG: DUF305 domain-containing protein [Actinobacteria bacterium]|nr:DUF305 domain-containing protein [Actinomycetota bacterium]